MNEELNKLLESLPEEEQGKFIENAKKQIQAAIKTAAEKKAKEEQKKQFKATGHWETETEEADSKITLDITEDNKNEIIFDLNNGDISFALTKKEFFNFYNLLTDAYNTLKESKPSDDIFQSLKEIADAISTPHRCRKPFRDKIFYIR